MAATDLQALIDAAREGGKDAVSALVRALREGAGAPAEVLVRLAHEETAALRAAAVEGARGRSEPEVLAAVGALAGDDDDDVREALARALAAAPDWPLDDARSALARDAVDNVRALAMQACRGRPALVAVLLGRLGDDGDWIVRQAAAEALDRAEPEAALPALVGALARDRDRDVSFSCAKVAEGLLGKGGWPPAAERPALAALREAKDRLESLGTERFPRLAAWVEERLRTDLDLEKLRSFGTDLTEEAEQGRLPRAHGLDAACDAVVRAITGPAPRAAVLLGAPGTGKTAVVHELAHRLRTHPDGPWRVLRVSPAELLAGTLYLGEWQTKVRELLENAREPRKVLIYVPNLEELSTTGRSSRSDMSVATMLAPHIERGSIAIVGESTPEAYAAGLGGVGALRRLFPPIELREPGADATRWVLECVREEMEVEATDGALDRLIELAALYLPGTAQPGRAVGLLRQAAERAGEARLTERDVLTTLSTSTGIPVDFLDDRVPLDLVETRRFFERRVMGQPEAVDAVVDLVTLVKSGLTDPGKPFGVLLFVGPTGVGKTELARALAEMLFGDPGRLLRFDMSEYATHASYERLLGEGTTPGILTRAVREHPFSVVLLDEIEKAHLNVFDLCLQVFDAGRLTDAQGHVADFRRTIVILTSNLGSAVPTEAGVGFGQTAPPAAPDRDVVLREVRRFFRPEFLNRLDAIVSFRPLSLETAEGIARREVARVLERSGIARRRVTVDVDPSVAALLLRLGYSPAFGARPLKRTVEKVVLLPLARALASGPVEPGSVLRLRAQGERVDVERTAPADGPEAEPEDGGGSRALDAPALRARAAALRARAQGLEAERARLLDRSRGPTFWEDRAAARRALDAIHRLDAVLEDVRRLEGEAEGLLADAARPPRRGDARGTAALRRRAETVDDAARRLDLLLARAGTGGLGDAYVVVSRVKAEGEGLDGVRRLAAMYAGFAKARGFEAEPIDDRRGDDSVEDTVTLLVSGPGAHALLATEAGFHVLSRRWEERGKGRRHARETVRVEILTAGGEDPGVARDGLRVQARALRGRSGRLIPSPTVDVTLLDPATMTSVRAWTTGTREEAVARLLPLLHARIAHARSAPPGAIVRRYTLGPSPRVVDRASRRRTGRLDRVLEGDLDAFLAPTGTPPS